MKLRIKYALVALILVLVPVVPAVVYLAQPTDEAPKITARLLTIGNSFADNSTRLLPELSKAGGKELILYRANLGGHSLQQHVGYLQAFEADAQDPKGRPYQAKVDPVTKEKSGGKSLREALESGPWEFVTIQQVSQLSPLPETYQPYAGILVDYIRKYAPKAKILIHETWAYPEDCSRYQDPRFSYLQNPQVMHHDLKAAYEKLSTETGGLGIIPVGDAFQSVIFSANPIRLHRKGDIHANANGEFLGACMFYETIFHDSVLSNPYVPEGVTPEDAKVLRDVAHEAVAKTVKKQSCWSRVCGLFK